MNASVHWQLKADDPGYIGLHFAFSWQGSQAVMDNYLCIKICTFSHLKEIKPWLTCKCIKECFLH
jgi:hypothetical protein